MHGNCLLTDATETFLGLYACLLDATALPIRPPKLRRYDKRIQDNTRGRSCAKPLHAFLPFPGRQESLSGRRLIMHLAGLWIPFQISYVAILFPLTSLSHATLDE